MSLSETVVKKLIAQTMIDFSGRHEDIGHIFERHLNEVKDYLPRDTMLSDIQRAFQPFHRAPSRSEPPEKRQLALCHEPAGNR
jgi:hypothetical protein